MLLLFGDTRTMTTLMTDESIQRQARLHVLRLEYIRAFGKLPGGAVATDAAWLSDQLDHADEVKRANRLCAMCVRVLYLSHLSHLSHRDL